MSTAGTFDPEEAAILDAAFQAACEKLDVPPTDATTRKLVSLKIMAAAAEGERNFDRLTDLAIAAASGHRSWRGA